MRFRNSLNSIVIHGATLDKASLAQKARQSAVFVLASNDLILTGQQILTEYKTQSSVERKFRQLT